jgi:hypothetical protein
MGGSEPAGSAACLAYYTYSVRNLLNYATYSVVPKSTPREMRSRGGM